MEENPEENELVKDRQAGNATIQDKVCQKRLKVDGNIFARINNTRAFRIAVNNLYRCCDSNDNNETPKSQYPASCQAS